MTTPNLAAILSLETPIIVLIGERQLPLREVLALAPGSIIELPKQSDEELDLLVNNKRVGTGVAVKVGENFGLQISFIGDVQERIAALGSREYVAAPVDEDGAPSGQGFRSDAA